MNKKILFTVILAVLILKIFIIFNSRLTFYSDDAIYAEIARFWIQGKFNLVFHPTWPPLYPFLTFISFLFLRNWENSARMVSALSGSVLIIPLYFLGQKFLPPLHSLLLAILISILPPGLKISLLPLSDMLAVVLIISALVFFIYRRFYLSALVFGLVYLTRSEGLMFFGLSLVFLIIATRKVKTIGMFLLIFFLTISPYWIALKTQTGSFSLSQKAAAQIKQGHAFQLIKGSTWMQEIDSVKNPNYKSTYFKNGLSYLLEYSDWFWFLFKQKLNTWQGILLKNVPPWALAGAAVGLSFGFRNKYRWNSLYFVFLVPTAVVTTIFATPLADIRYLLWCLPIILLFFFVGVHNLFHLIAKEKLTITSALVSAALILIFPSSDFSAVLNPRAYAADFTNNYQRQEIEAAGDWIKKNSDKPNPKIMARHEGIEFYADGETIYLPQGLTLDETLEYAKRYGVSYIAAAGDELASDQNLSPLLQKDFQHQGLKKVFLITANSRTIVIYETSFGRF